MESWRDLVLSEFEPGAGELILVADPDRLLVEEEILRTLRERNYEVIIYDDPVHFRFLYESKYKPRQKQDSSLGLVVIVQTSNLYCLPYDLWQTGRRVSFSLADIFPQLSYRILVELDRADFEPLYEACQGHCHSRLGDNATKDFVLNHVFGIFPERIREPHELLHVLIRHHYQRRRLPEILEERFIQVLQSKGGFTEWPLEQIVSDQEAFFAFLQERWKIFLDRLVHGNSFAAEPVATYDLRFDGPLLLPFDHPELRPYMDNLFLEGYLTPVPHPQASRLADQWVSVGLKKDPWERFLSLAAAAEKSIPKDHARYHEWLEFAWRWAELTVLYFELPLAPGEHLEEKAKQADEMYGNLRRQVDKAFLIWMQQRYSALYNQPTVPPAMVHHIPRYLAYLRDKKKFEKLALIVVDGLALDQWLVVKEVLADRWPQFRFHESAVFAWVPTLTSVSRQAIFAGEPPLFFASYLDSTGKECSLWLRFWADQGLREGEIGYLNVAGDESPGKEVGEILERRSSVLGLVIQKVDKIMHGVELGTAGMHNQVRQWAQMSYLGKLLEFLVEEGFEVFLTSDHGNLEAQGIGRPAEGATVDYRGYRARIYSDKGLRKRTKEQFPEALEWESIGLPDNFLPLLAAGRSAFCPKGEKVVCHGGISVEEVIVPFVHVERVRGKTL
ncbi:BREX-3 system phosphatase PglZ [Desulfothermobacter acidiphilus]|uniref:BREX-3 system phosphatase PglZ n=1 Tax=Desulfothermobacter acidiphilus TaxID=1938353 RepID=UPI003F888830